MSSDKLKVLCLHGYRQNGVAFREKLGAFRKSVKDLVEFEFITSPHVIPNEDLPDGHGWWFATSERTFSAKQVSDISVGLEESLAVIKEVFEQKGPFHGILGFSQGAAMAAILCGMMQLKECPFSFEFAMLFSAFQSRSSPHSHYYEELIDIPTLHVYGENDQVIGREMSETFLQYFKDPQVIVHDGGHFVPANAKLKSQYKDFLTKMKDGICTRKS